MASVDIELVRDLHRGVVTARTFLQPRWPALQRAYGVPSITADGGTCIVSTEFLRLLLLDRGITTQRRYGAGERGAGYFNGVTWCDHAWLEHESGGLLLDCTPDQMGTGEKYIKRANDPHYRSEIGTIELGDKRERFLQRWRQEWLQARAAGVLLPLTRPTKLAAYNR